MGFARRPLTDPSQLEMPALPIGRTFWRRFRRHKMALTGLGMFLLLSLLAVFATWIAPYSPSHMDYGAILQPPGPRHLLGTDSLGHDWLSDLLYGGRVTLLIGFSTTVFLVVVGTLVGAVSGYFGGWLDRLLMRFVDIMLTFPVLLLQIALASQFGGKQSILMIIFIIGIFSWPAPARLIRGQILAARNLDYVAAARATGASDWRIIVRHLLPNAIGPMLVSATLNISQAIIVSSILSFLGMGVQPPTPSWGNMIGLTQTDAAVAPWLVIFPGLAIVLACLSINFIGDGIRDALDPTAMVRK